MQTNVIYNKDCLELLKELEDNSIDCIITDPPYGVLRHKIENGFNQDGIDKLMNEYYRVLRDNSFLVFFGQQPTLTFWNTEALKLFRYKNEIIWYKRESSPFQKIGRDHENIMIFAKGNKQVNKIYRPFVDVVNSLAEFKEKDTILLYIQKLKSILGSKKKLENCIKGLDNDKSLYCRPENNNTFVNVGKHKGQKDRYIADYLTVCRGYAPSSVVSFRPHNKQKYSKDDYNIKHPTVKPVQLIEYLIDLCTKKNHIVLDTFLGSGTTGLACKNLNRRYIGCELDSEYFKICEDRINKAKIELNNKEFKGSDDDVNVEYQNLVKGGLFDRALESTI